MTKKKKKDPAIEIQEFADAMGFKPKVSEWREEELVNALRSMGHNVTLSPLVGEGFHRTKVPQAATEVTFGVISDTHLGSKAQQLSYLWDFYDYAKAEGCEYVIHAGDIADGHHKAHRGAMLYEQFKYGFEEQTDYIAANYPDQLPTKAINGNHDLWFYTDAGANVVKKLSEVRDDIEYLGDEGAYLMHGPIKMFVWHPAGGSAYARSYRLQKWIEQVPAEDKPNLLWVGNWHISSVLPTYRNVTGATVPCFQAQTAYMRRKGLSPDIGGYVVRVRWDKRGKITDVRMDFRMYREPMENDYA